MQIRKNLEKNSEEDDDNGEELFNLNREFYELIPYRPRYQDFISHKRIIATKQELCQVSVEIVFMVKCSKLPPDWICINLAGNRAVCWLCKRGC